MVEISNPMDYKVALYIRLSKEDDSGSESQSVTNQRNFLLQYAKENSLDVFDIYADDGFSGTSFNRPSKPVKLDGCYVIETTHTELTGAEIWKLYMSLTRIEGAFRAMKSELGFRPVYHQNSERTEGHLFVSVLAYHLLNAIEIEMSKSGDHRLWSTLRVELSTHQRCTLIMTAEDGSVHHIRMSGTPESEHKKIYDALGVKDPLKKISKLAKYGL